MPPLQTVDAPGQKRLEQGVEGAGALTGGEGHMEYSERAISFSLDMRYPGAAITASHLAKHLFEEHLVDWAMMQSGVVKPPDWLRSSSYTEVTTSQVLFIGDPVAGITMANRNLVIGLAVDLLVLGVTENTPPVSQAMLRNVGLVMAFPESLRWLKRNRVSRAIGVRMGEGRGAGQVAQRDQEVRILWEGDIPRLPGSLSFPSRHRKLAWNQLEVPPSADDLNAQVFWADVCVRQSLCTLDDGLSVILSSAGVLEIPLEPIGSLPLRIAEAARLRRAGVVGRGTVVEAPSGTLPTVEDCLRNREALLRNQEALLPEADAPVNLGVVIPFGGLPVGQLEGAIRAVQEVAGELPIVVALQQHAGSGWWGTEAPEVAKLTGRLGVELAKHDAVGKDGCLTPWNPSRARNVGAHILPPRVTHVVFMDVDIRPTPGYFTGLVETLSCNPNQIPVSYVRNESGDVRFGTGVATIPRWALDKVEGFDEGFIGWGYEDLDFLVRCARATGVGASVFGSPSNPYLTHLDHEKRRVGTRERNRYRYQQVVKG